MDELFKIYVVSDSLGDTAEMVARATAEQYHHFDYEIRRFSYIANEEQVMEIIDNAIEEKAIIVFTTVLSHVREKLVEECEKNDIIYMDVLKPLLKKFSEFLDQEPLNKPGIIHKLDEKYFKRVDAVEFAVKYDDGKDPRGIKKADIVLLGVSRTSKTPLSLYLANKNIKVANIPLVPEVPIPKEIYEIPVSKIIGLTTDPIKLNEIRKERLKALGLSDSANYANMERILSELDYANEIMKKLGCPVIDTASKAIEETANIILEIIEEYED